MEKQAATTIFIIQHGSVYGSTVEIENNKATELEVSDVQKSVRRMKTVSPVGVWVQTISMAGVERGEVWLRV